MDLATWLREASTNRQAEADLGAMSADVDADAPAAFAVVNEPAEAPVSLPGASDIGDGGQGDVAAGD